MTAKEAVSYSTSSTVSVPGVSNGFVGWCGVSDVPVQGETAGRVLRRSRTAEVHNTGDGEVRALIKAARDRLNRP